MTRSRSMMRTKHWRAFSHDQASFHCPGAALLAQWKCLHRGDCEPYPDIASLAERLRSNADGDSPERTVANVQEAWRVYHSGDFERAFELGTHAGAAGFVVAIKTLVVYASYLESSAAQAQVLLLQAVQAAEATLAKLPHEPNAHYLLAFALGRYSQRISIVEALARGYATKIHRSLQRALELEPRHCEAHIASGLYHAELIGKVGTLVAGISHGASREQAIDHFKRAVKLAPDAPAPRLEYANGLRVMGGNDQAQIGKLLRRAANSEQLDAVARLDIEAAKVLLQS